MTVAQWIALRELARERNVTTGSLVGELVEREARRGGWWSATVGSQRPVRPLLLPQR